MKSRLDRFQWELLQYTVKKNPELSPVIYIYTGFQLFLEARWAHTVFLLPPDLFLFYDSFLLVFYFLEKSALSFSFFPLLFSFFVIFSPKQLVNAMAVHLLSYGRTWEVALLHIYIYQCLFAVFVFCLFNLKLRFLPLGPWDCRK